MKSGAIAAQPTHCPLTAAMNAIGSKWSLICLYWLDSGTRRFSDLERLIPEISHKVLTETLRNLEREGLISRTVSCDVPPRVDYQISEYGETVRPLVEAIRLWGRQHLERARRLTDDREESAPPGSSYE
jgi:DNA-binding HxlR family transcriptional regulator